MHATADGMRQMPARSGRSPAPGRTSLIALALCAAAVLAVGAMGIGTARLLREQAFEDAERNLGNLAHALAAQTSQVMRTLDITLDHLVSEHLDEHVRAAGIGVRERLQSNLASLPMLRSLVIGDAEGRVIHAAPETFPVEGAIADPEVLYVHLNMQGGLAFGRPVAGGPEGSPDLRVSRPLRSPDGSLAGVIGGSLDVDYFLRLFASLKLGEGGAITLLRDDAVVMMRVPAVPGAVGMSLADGVVMRATRAAGRDVVMRHVSRLDGQARITALWRVPDYPLYVAASLPEAVVAASWQRWMGTGALGAGILTTMLALLGAVTYRAVRQRESVEARLHADAGRYRLLFERNPDPMWMFDQGTGAILDVNAAAVAAYGYTRDEFLAMPLSDLELAEDGAATAGNDHLRDRHGAGPRARHHRRKDGTAFEVEVSRDRFDLDGRPVGLALVRDVSARIAAERRLADFMAASADWMWETDADLRMIWVSPNIEQILGVAPEWHYGKRRQDIIAEAAWRDEAQAHQADIAARRPFKDFEYLRATPTGPRWVRTSGVPYFDADGTFLGYRGVGQDITAIKSVQARLIDAIESIPAGVIVFDRDDRVVMLNSSAVSASFPELPDTDPVQGRQFEKALRALVAGGVFVDALADPEAWIAWRMALHRNPGPPIVLRLNDGRAVEVHERRMSDGGSILLRFDVTDRLNAEERLAASQARLKAAMDATIDGIIMIGADGRIITVNKSAENLFGYAEAELVGRNVSMLMPEPYRSEHDRYLADYLRTREAKVIGIGREVRGLRKDGSEFALDLAVAELPREVGAGRFIGTVRDITQRKLLDAQLREAQKMQALGQLTGGIAHDFNNLLAVIALNLETAAPRVAGDRLLKEMIELSLQAAGRGAELTSRLLAFARRQPLTPRPLDLGAELQELGRLLHRTMPEQISVQIRTGIEPVAAELDGPQLQNALLNLALNARDAMPKGGRLTIALAARRIDEHEIEWPDPVPAGDYAVISVSDTGEGIVPEVLNRVLDPFFTTKPAGQGTGLGLSMVYGFVRQSGGWLQIESDRRTEQAESGTTIRLLFPRSTAMPEARPPGATEAAELPPRRILLVEDYDDLRRSLAAMLRQLDCEIVATADAEAALAVLDGPERLDGLITDIGLPGAIDGWRLARLALARRPELRIITMSGHADPPEAEAGERPWQGPHLRKPFRRADMAAALRAAFSSRPDPPE